MVEFAVNAGAVAMPEAFVSTTGELPNVPLAPVVTTGELTKVPLGPVEGGAVNVTLTPGTGLLKESLTRACSNVPKFVVTAALWGVPANDTMVAGGPGKLVRLKLGVDEVPITDAVTTNEPAIVFAVNCGAVAFPLASVNTTLDPPNDPLGPLPGRTN